MEKILVIEDEKAINDLIVMNLKLENHIRTVCKHGYRLEVRR